MMRFRLVPVIAVALLLAACGTRVPQIEEVWEPVGITDDLKHKIRAKIFCETVDAIREARKISCSAANAPPKPCLPDSYGVQIQTTITIDESTGFNPSVGLLDALSGGTIATNITSAMTSSATRVDTAYAYHNVARISGKDANTWCKDPVIMGKIMGESPGSSMLLRADLGITDYLMKAVRTAALFHSSPAVKGGAGKTAKLDVFSYQIKFVAVTSGGVNPVIRLTSLATGVGNQPLLSMGRTRTHDLTLTFGPGKDEPILSALQTHFGGQLAPSR